MPSYNIMKVGSDCHSDDNRFLRRLLPGNQTDFIRRTCSTCLEVKLGPDEADQWNSTGLNMATPPIAAETCFTSNPFAQLRNRHCSSTGRVCFSGVHRWLFTPHTEVERSCSGGVILSLILMWGWSSAVTPHPLHQVLKIHDVATRITNAWVME